MDQHSLELAQRHWPERRFDGQGEKREKETDDDDIEARHVDGAVLIPPY